ncbi:hypothetical protein NQ028_13125 [Corynebacterium phoceense]|uniref:hypothetical protein n=1 Tax=Corynebacterium phoceense TaxID=1686286 RepID=UPI00211B92F4|nr:hypothetical protein [Corynebacterium phoceense]MCQ9342062.1 hypothetical protein [Corynebacterium phoceense]
MMIPNGSASETKEFPKLREERDILRKAAKYFAEVADVELAGHGSQVERRS